MPEEFSSSFTFDTSKAIADIQRLSTQIDTYSLSLSKNASATKAFNAQQGKVDKTVGSAGTAANKAKKSIKDLGNQTKVATAEAARLELSWRSVLRVFAIQVVGRAVSSLTSELSQSVGRARELQVALAEVQTISPELRGLDLTDVSKFTEAISIDFGIEQIEVAAGLYQSLSNQVGNAAQTLDFLNEAAEFSVATNTKLSASVDLLSGALNALGLNSSQNRRIMDILFKTIELGRIRGEELANAFGKILPLADELGVSLEEVAASVAAMTIQGVAFDKTSVLLTRVMTGLLKPTKALETTFDNLGIASVRAGIQAHSLAGFLKLLLDQTDGTIEGTSEFFNELRELQGVLLVTADGGNKVAETLARIQKEASGAARAAAELILESPAKQLDKSIKEFQAVILSDFGTPAIGVINDIIAGLGGASNAAKVFFTVVAAGAAVIIPILAFQLAGAIGGMTAALITATAAALGFNIAITAGPAFALAAAIVTVATAAILLNDTLNNTPDRVAEITTKLDGLKEASEGVRATVLENQQKINEALKKTASEGIGTVIKGLFELQKLWLKDRDSAIAAQQQATANLDDQVSQRIKLIERGLKKIVNAEQSAADAINKINEKAAAFLFRVNQGRFERNFKALGKDTRRQAQALKKRVKDLIAISKKEAAKGDVKQAEFFSDIAFRRATQLADLTGRRRQGEAAINLVLKERKRIQETEAKQALEQAKAAKAVKVPLKAQIALLKKNVIEREKLQKQLITGIGKLGPKEVSNLQSRLDEVNDLVEKGSKEIAITFGVAKIDKEIIEGLNKQFESAITGKPIKLTIAAKEAVDRTIQILDRIPSSVRVDLKLKIKELTKEDIDIRGFGTAQDKLGELSQEFARGIDNSSQYAAAQLKVGDALNQIQAAGTGVVNAAKDIATQAAKSTGPLLGLVTSVQPKLINFIKQFINLRNSIEKATRSGDLGALRNLQTEIANLQAIAQEGITIKGIGDIDQSQLTNTLSILSSVTAKSIEANAALQQATEQKAKVSALFIDIQNLSSLIKDPGLGQSAVNNFNTIGNSAQQQISKVNALTAAVKELNKVQSSGPVQGKSRGGPVQFFDKGGQARGTDTIPAMLTKGEFVVNAASSRRFFSELVAINSGKSPIYRQEGGPVTNNTFTGDINVNLPEGQSVDGRIIAKQLRRELRRNTSRIGS